MTIPLQFAFLCVNCDMVGDSSCQCPHCGGESLLSLSGILNRQIVFPIVRPEYGDSEYKGK